MQRRTYTKDRDAPLPLNKHDYDTIDVNGTAYIAAPYTEVTWRVGNQRRVANGWLSGDLPTHYEEAGPVCTLTTGTRNFKGIQRPDGSGRLKHYKTTEAIRTVNQGYINNSQCWSKGFARCTTPLLNTQKGMEYRATLPLTTIESGDFPDPRYIVDVVVGDSYDADDYDRLVFFHNCDPYRASKDGIDSTPLDPESGEFRRYINTIEADL